MTIYFCQKNPDKAPEDILSCRSLNKCINKCIKKQEIMFVSCH